MKIKFLVLANSFKHKGRCVAGIDLNNKRLIRLIPKGEKDSIPTEEVRSLRPLDIIETEISDNPAPKEGAQSENYYVSIPFKYIDIGKGNLNEIKKYVGRSDFKMYPFGTINNKLSPQGYYYKDYSIDIIVAYNINLTAKPNHRGVNKIFASFNVYSGKNTVSLKDYHVTDPVVSLYYHQNNVNHYGKAYLVVTIPSKQGGDSYNYYKFIAAIIPFDKKDSYADKTSNDYSKKRMSIEEVIALINKHMGIDK